MQYKQIFNRSDCLSNSTVYVTMTKVTFMNYILLLDKPKDYTSRDIVNIVGKKLGTKKIGHTGTLDPIATGVLVLCVGNATKMVEIITALEKEYIADIILGTKTDTGDITGNVVEEQMAIYSKQEIEQACHKMIKTYEQTVPIYSAVKVNGKKLYSYAREGKDVQLPTREVTIHSLECLGEPVYEKGKTIIQIRTLVSKGTYIRSLIEDLACTLHTIGTMSSLRRIKQGEYYIEDCNTLEDIESGNFQLHNYSHILSKYPAITVDSYLEKRIRNGSILENRYQTSVILFQDQHKNPLALYRVYEKDNTKIKPWKML